jgi:ATP-dependent helicase/nuclease subunit A
MTDGDYDLESNTGKYALKSSYFSPFSLYCASSYLDLLMTAAAQQPSLFSLSIVSGAEENEKAEDAAEDIVTEKEDLSDMPYYAAKKLVSEKLDYVYPYRKLSEIPSKLAVSKLYPNVLDEPEDVFGDEMPTAVSMPNFLMKEPDESFTAAQKGTAMHTFMQFCDFENVLRNGVQAEIMRLAEKRFIFESDVEKMDIEKLSAFFESRLAKSMMNAKRIFREKRFMIKLPSSLFSEEESEILKNEKLLVQGVIDCAFFDEKGELILVDYKTDFFREGTPHGYIIKTLRERHKRQLSYYQMACEQLFGVYPKHTYIYAFALNGIVEI